MVGFDLDCLELVANEQNADGALSEECESGGTSSESDSGEECSDGGEVDGGIVNDQVAAEFELKLSLNSGQVKEKPLIELLD